MTDGVVQEDGKRILTKPTIIINALWNAKELDMPLLNGHDFTKLLGWTHNFGVYSEPGLTRLLIKSNLAENKSEFEEVKKKIAIYFQILYIKQKNDFDNLENLIKTKLKEEYYYLDRNCVSILSKNVLFDVLPEIETKIDDEGLYNIKGITHLGEGVFKYGKFAIFSHVFFRRSFHMYNSLNIPFFNRLDEIEDKSSLKIRLDPNIIGLAKTFKHSTEWKYWWGPKFDNDISKIQNGETVHGTTNNGEYLTTFFRWGDVNGKKVFEVEELPNNGIDLMVDDSENLYGCRYAHSIYFPEISEFHFDGAIRGYTIEEYSKRLSLKLSETPKKQEYTKLWRYDGKLTITQWKDILTHYFRDNMLIGEYLSGKDDYLKKRLLKNDEDEEQAITKEKSIETELTFRIMISFKEKVDLLKKSMSMIYKFKDLPYSVPKQFLKLLESEDFDYTHLDDLIIHDSIQKWCYIPPIFVKEQDMTKNLLKLNKTLKKFVEYLENKKICEYMCLNFILPIENNLLNLSLIGEKSYVIEFFNQFKIIPFKNYSVFEKWIEKVLHFIYGIPNPHEKILNTKWFNNEGFFKIK